MTVLKSKKVIISLILLITSAAILCAVNPAPILLLYKIIHVKYVRIAKSDFASRFNDTELAEAYAYAKNQPWVQKQIQSDLAPFKQGVKHTQIEHWFKTIQDPVHSKLAKFTVKNKIVTVDVPNELKSSRAYKTIYSVIELLAAKGYIPNCEFIVALNDHVSRIPPDEKLAAIFSFAKHTEVPVEQNFILIPDWMNVRYWDVLRQRIKLANKLYPWSRKKNMIHWRGGLADSMSHRINLVNLKHQYKFLDVGMTAGKDAVPFVDPELSILYKYQISLDGVRCTWERMVWQMSANTVLIKPDSPQVQWFYTGLEPYKNYVPIKTVDAQNIQNVYTWLQEHDSEAKEISKNANEFAKNNFKTQDFFAYYALLLQEYAKLYEG